MNRPKGGWEKRRRANTPCEAEPDENSAWQLSGQPFQSYRLFTWVVVLLGVAALAVLALLGDVGPQGVENATFTRSVEPWVLKTRC